MPTTSLPKLLTQDTLMLLLAMTLRKYNGYADESGAEGVMQLDVCASDGELKTILQWMARNDIVVAPAKTALAAKADCVTTDGWSGKKYRSFLFRKITPSVVGLRLSFSTFTQHPLYDSLYLAYCDMLVHKAFIMEVPKKYRIFNRDITAKFYGEIHNWASESGIRLVNLAEIWKDLDSLPLKGRVMFIHYFIGTTNFMSVVMFLNKSDAALYKLTFSE